MDLVSKVLETIEYEPTTGRFYSKVHTSNHKIGDEIKGTLTRKGYIKISVRNKTYFAHRLAFICMGEDLPEQVDHINSIKTDNRWSNLRPATQQENQWNTGVRGDSYSGYKNVYWREQRRRWIVIIPTTDGNKYIGSFIDKEEANKAAVAARQQYQGEWGIDVR